MKRIALLMIFVFNFLSCQQQGKKSELKIERKIEIQEKSETNKISINPITRIRRIFDDYVRNQESTDSEENLEIMSKSLQETIITTNPKDLDLLINIWMYYDPTDFPTRQLVYKSLSLNKTVSIKAIKARIINKMDWEQKDNAPFSELKILLEQLERGE